MRSKAGMANRQGDVDLRFEQVSAPHLELWVGLACLLTWCVQCKKLFVTQDRDFDIVSGFIGEFGPLDVCE